MAAQDEKRIPADGTDPGWEGIRIHLPARSDVFLITLMTFVPGHGLTSLCIDPYSNRANETPDDAHRIAFRAGRSLAALYHYAICKRAFCADMLRNLPQDADPMAFLKSLDKIGPTGTSLDAWLCGRAWITDYGCLLTLSTAGSVLELALRTLWLRIITMERPPAPGLVALAVLQLATDVLGLSEATPAQLIDLAADAGLPRSDISVPTSVGNLSGPPLDLWRKRQGVVSGSRSPLASAGVLRVARSIQKSPINANLLDPSTTIFEFMPRELVMWWSYLTGNRVRITSGPLGDKRYSPPEVLLVEAHELWRDRQKAGIICRRPVL